MLGFQVLFSKLIITILKNIKVNPSLKWYILDCGANWCSSGEWRTLWSRPMATERQVWTMAVLWWELFLAVAAPSWSPFPMEGRHGAAKEKKKVGVYPSLQSGSSESSPLCVLGWAHVRQGTIRLLFLWGKQWHPVAIIYGRKYLMFLEEAGCGGVRKKGKPDLPLVPSTSDLVDRTGPV